jgi:flagellar hook-associated protein 3 FlgL
MRITFGMTASTSLRNIQLNQERMATVENQLTSSSKINKPSDDPIGAARAIGLQESIDQAKQYLKNIDQGNAWLNQTDSTLGAVTQDIQRARELAVQAANGTLSPSDRRAIQLEIGQLQQSVLDLSHAKVGSYFIFSGSKSDKQGYMAAVSSKVSAAAYQGNDSAVQREVTPGVAVGVNADARATFDPVFKALSQVMAGLAPSGAVPASTPAVVTAGAAPGVIAPGSTLTVNGVSVTLTGGPPDVEINAALGAAVPPPSPNGVTASLSSGVLVFTSTNTGSDATVNMTAAPAVLATLGLTTTSASGLDDQGAIQARLQASLTSLDDALDAIGVSRAQVGAKSNRLETLGGRQEAVATNLAGLLSQVKDVDMAEAITNFTMAQNVYQASLKSAAQALQTTLLDYLR